MPRVLSHPFEASLAHSACLPVSLSLALLPARGVPFLGELCYAETPQFFDPLG